jgi:integrase/predicted DNA-binding transcriptional regulator AlpA
MRNQNTLLQASSQLLTPTEASVLLGVPEKTLAHWRTERTGPLAIHVGARVRYRLSDVEEWIGGRVEEARRRVVAPIGRPRLAPGEHGDPWIVTLPHGRYRAVVRVRDRDGRVREVTATADTKGGAKRALLRKVQGRSTCTSIGVAANTSIEELGAFWLEHRARTGNARSRRHLAPQTLAIYQAALRSVLDPAIGGLRIGESSVGLLEAVFADLDERGISTAHARSVLNQMLTLAVRHGALETNPMVLVTPPVRKGKGVAALDVATAWELRRIVRVKAEGKPGRRKPTPDLRDFIDVGLGTGGRIGEILALTWSRLDLDCSIPTMQIDGTLVEPRKGYVARLHRQNWTKSRSVRRLILPAYVATLLRERRAKAGALAPDSPVFASPSQTWLWPNNLRTRLRAAIVGTMLEGTTPHTLRRTVGTLVAHEAGLDAAREQLGHSDPSLTWRSYVAARPVAPDLRKILDAFFDKG